MYKPTARSLNVFFIDDGSRVEENMAEEVSSRKVMRCLILKVEARLRSPAAAVKALLKPIVADLAWLGPSLSAIIITVVRIGSKSLETRESEQDRQRNQCLKLPL